jgi:hypothetical protein
MDLISFKNLAEPCNSYFNLEEELSEDEVDTEENVEKMKEILDKLKEKIKTFGSIDLNLLQDKEWIAFEKGYIKDKDV